MGVLRSRRQSLWRQYVTLQFRATCSYSRHPANAAGRTVMAVGLAVLVGAVFFRQPSGALGQQQSCVHMHERGGGLEEVR